MMRPTLVLAFVALFATASVADESISATLFKNEGCKCCDRYADYLRANGFKVTVVAPPNMTVIKQKFGVREDLEGCHTTVIDGYAIEGHVPVASIKRLLSEKPAIKGISLPGMPEGSPGMSGEKAAPFEILTISGDDKPAPVYARE